MEFSVRSWHCVEWWNYAMIYLCKLLAWIQITWWNYYESWHESLKSQPQNREIFQNDKDWLPYIEISKTRLAWGWPVHNLYTPANQIKHIFAFPYFLYLLSRSYEDIWTLRGWIWILGRWWLLKCQVCCFLWLHEALKIVNLR